MCGESHSYSGVELAACNLMESDPITDIFQEIF